MPRWKTEAVAAVGGEWNVLDQDGNNDYQGWGAILTRDNRVLSWGYGSCSGCDRYENMETTEEVIEALEDLIETYDDPESAREAYTRACSQGW